jgi:protein SCO1/2
MVRLRHACVLAALACSLWCAVASAADVVNTTETAFDSAFDSAAALRASQAVIGTRIGEHTLYDRSGRAFMLSSLRGRPLLVSFVYTGCSQVCPLSTKILEKAVASAQRALGSGRFTVLTIGFNLPYDSPAAMADFARRQGVALPDWKFASPDAASVQRLTREFGFDYRATTGGFDHITQISIVDADGRIVRQVYGDDFDLPLLVEPLKQLLTGSPAEFSGLAQMIDKVRLVCTVYDPVSGQYRLSYAVLIEILSGISVFVAVLLFMRKGRRRRSVGSA